MQRRRLLLLAPLVPLGIFVSRYLRALAPKIPQPVDYQAQALKLNQLATNIHTVADARMLVDFIAGIFSDYLQPAWSDNKIRGQVAEAEFATVSEPNRLIPEQRLAETWNTYAQTIQAPPSCQVTAAEIHICGTACSLRPACFGTGAVGTSGQLPVFTRRKRMVPWPPVAERLRALAFSGT